MDRINAIKAKLEKIESLLFEIKSELEILSKEADSKPKKPIKEEILPSDEELKSEYNGLYQEFIKSNLNCIHEFIEGKSKVYLKNFCRANNLPIDTTKASKNKIAEVVMQWMAQRKAITQKAT